MGGGVSGPGGRKSALRVGGGQGSVAGPPGFAANGARIPVSAYT